LLFHHFLAIGFAMTTMAFDTLSVAKRLQKAGFTAQQAEAMTAIVSEA
jgi:hypothetical protein